MTAPPQFRTPDQGPVLPEGEVARGFDFEAANPNVNPDRATSRVICRPGSPAGWCLRDLCCGCRGHSILVVLFG